MRNRPGPGGDLGGVDVDDPSGLDRAVPGHPDVLDLGGTSGVDDSPKWIVGSGERRGLAIEDDEIGGLPRLDRTYIAVEPQRPGPPDRGHLESIRRRERRRLEAVDPLKQHCGLHRLEHVLAVVAGGPVDADPNGDAEAPQLGNRANAGSEDHVRDGVVGDSDAVLGEHLAVVGVDPHAVRGEGRSLEQATPGAVLDWADPALGANRGHLLPHLL